jgi:hypothetical protein
VRQTNAGTQHKQHKESRSPELWYVLHSLSLSFSPIFLFGCLSLFDCYLCLLLVPPSLSSLLTLLLIICYISFLIITHHWFMFRICHSSLSLAVCLPICLCISLSCSLTGSSLTCCLLSLLLIVVCFCFSWQDSGSW